MKENKTHLLTIGHSYVIAANRSIVREVAKDKGFSVTVVAPRFFHGSLSGNPIEPEPEGSALTVIPVSAYLTQKMHIFTYNPWELKQVFNRYYDVAHLWEEPYILAGFQLAHSCHKNKIPFCVRTAQSLVKDYPYPFSVFDKRVKQWSARWVAGGDLVRQAMLKKNWDPNLGVTINLSVDTDRFRPMEKGLKEHKKRELGLQGTVIGFLSRLTEAKGCEILMRMLEGLEPAEPWSVLIMGSGPYEEKIKRWAKEKGLADRVIVRLFKHDEVPDVLPVCDVLVCPSQTRKFWKEQFGRMVVEAFAAGVAVIGSDSGEIPNVIGDAGLVVGESDVKAWVEALSGLLSNPGLRAELIQKGLERGDQFSSKTIAERYKSFYTEITTEHPRVLPG